jgi:hypothetical protein
VLDAGVDPGRERGRNFPRVGRVALPFGLHLAAKTNQPREAIRLDRFLAENLGRLAAADSPPQIELKQPVLRGDKTLREEQIALILGVDMGDAPLIAEHLDRFEQTRQTNLSFQLGQHRFGPLPQCFR